MQLIGAVFARGPAPASDDALACMVLTQLLGAGRSSALREHLRAEGDVYDVSAGLALDRTASVLSIAASFDQDRAVEGTGSILSAIRDVRAGKTTDDQVAIARETALSRWRLQLATVRGAAAAYALWLSLGLGPQALRELPARLAKVGREDVVRAAARYLQEGSLHVTYLGEDRWIDPRPLGMGGMATLDLPQ